MRKLLQRIGGGWLWLAVLAIGIYGQQAEYTQNKPDQTLRATGRVNPSSLGMEMQIPLGGYPGRGLQVPINLSYSSKLWRLQYTESYPTLTSNGVHNPPCHPTSRPVYSENSASGWTSAVSVPYLEYTGADNIYEVNGFPVSDSGDCGGPGANTSEEVYIRRIEVHLPGGEAHELRPDDNYVSFLVDDPNSTSFPDLQSNWDTTFYATDGSNLIYRQDSANGLYRLSLPDGAYYDFAPTRTEFDPTNVTDYNKTVRRATALTDLNGNRVEYHTAGSAQYPNGYITDTLGRNIPLPFAATAPTAPTPANQPQLYQLPGFGGGSPLTYRFHWKRLKGDTAAESGLTEFGQPLAYRASERYDPYNPSSRPPGSTVLFHNGTRLAWTLDSGGLFNPIVLTEIELPDNSRYQFSYNLYGEIERITYPTGGVEQFEYARMPPQITYGNQDVYDGQENRGVASRKVLETGDTSLPAITWSYSATRETDGYRVKTVAPDGTWSSRRQIVSQPRPCNNPSCPQVGSYGYGNVLGGMVDLEEQYAANGQMLSKTITDWTSSQLPVSTPVGGLYTGFENITGAGWHPRVVKTENIVYDLATGAALSATTTMDYDGDLQQRTTALNVKTVSQYGYTTAPGNLGTLLKSSETTYLNDAAHTANNLRTLPELIRTKNAAGTPVAQSQIFYDETGYGAGGARGQATRTRRWSDVAGNQYVETRAKYDAFGNVSEATDARGATTQMFYDDNYSDGLDRSSNALPTRTVAPVPGGNGSTTAFETTVKYDFNTGLPVSSKDANNLETRMEYNDALLRPTKMQQYFGGLPVGAASETVYGAGTNAATRFVKSRTQIDADHWKEGYSWFDGLGRGIKTQSVDSSGDVFVKTLYDAVGRVSKTSNPYRGANTADNQLEWTEVQYDAAGRAYKTITPDGAAVQTAYSLATTGDTIGTAVTVTDQALKQRRSITNALGQLKRVDEPTDANGLGLVNSPNQPTYYAYDTLNNLTTVVQGGQTRSFVYDSLSRLKSATNPEMGTTATNGTIQYQYDDNGNLTKKTDARLVETNYVYDGLNRVSSRSYVNEPTGQTATPSVSYLYDNAANAKGKLTKVTATRTGTNAFTAVTDYQAFDTLGRVTQSQQTIDGTAYGDPQIYKYNLSGALIEETYPSGRVVKNVLDADGDLSIVQSKKNGNAGYFNYAKSFSYTAAGAVSSMQLGNGKWESTVFNSRLQPTQIALGGTPNATNLLKLDFAYTTTPTATDNNGNVLRQTITTPSETHGNTTYPAFVATQAYTYDSLNRLNSAEETSPTQPGWRQTYLYDRYGNRNFDTSSDANGIKTTTIPLGCATAVCNPTVDPNTNKLVGYAFDNAGNTKTDANGKQFIYDAENHQTLVKNGSNVVIGEYFYDGDGKRVKKIAGSEVTIFVYDAGGKLVAEYANQIAATQQVSYLTSDHLGSPRINTDQNGQVISRHDYQPFGEEIARPSYGDDEVRKQFTSYERDNETELDFAQARYYSNQHGRFTSPDPVMLSPKRMVNPQMINLYVYAVNNPFSYIDRDGQENVQLGEDSEKKIKSDLEDVNKRLKKDKKNEELKAQKKTLETSLGAVREGNRVVGAWLQALKSRGEDNGMQLSDFTFSTNPQADLATAARADGRSEATIANEQQYWQGGENGAVGTVIGGKIYILNNSNTYVASSAGGGQNDTVGVVGAGDLSILGGTYLRHEKDHLNPAIGGSEYKAFSGQFNLLNRINNSNKPFQNQKYFKDISNGIQRKIAEAKSAEGVK